MQKEVDFHVIDSHLLWNLRDLLYFPAFLDTAPSRKIIPRCRNFDFRHYPYGYAKSYFSNNYYTIVVYVRAFRVHAIGDYFLALIVYAPN